MKIGFSLPVTYLNGIIANEEERLWQQIFGPPQSALEYLRNLGVTWVEVNKLRKRTAVKEIQNAVKLVQNEGLNLTIHGWLPRNVERKDFLNLIKGLSFVPKGSLQSEVILTVHGHRVADENQRDTAFSDTVDDLIWCSKQLETENWPFIIALEVCRIKEKGPVGTTYKEVFSLVDQVGVSKLGICWDFGHSQRNYEIGGDVQYPGEKFVNKVIHTHIHTVGPDGRTHFPLSCSRSYISDGLRMLKQVNYQGVHNLELYPIRWALPADKCKEKLASSIINLKKIIAL